MGGGALADDKEAMSLRLALSFALVALAGLATTSSALAAAGLGEQRVVAHPKVLSQPSRATTESAWIAPPAACPGQDDLAAPTAAQEQAMNCMVDFARRQAGLNGLAEADALSQSARAKSLDLLRCDSFSHYACGRDFTYWMKASGYTATRCWRVGENLAWGTGEQGSARSIFIAWMRSETHRANILGDFEESGLSLEVGSLEGLPETRVWTEHFGARC